MTRLTWELIVGWVAVGTALAGSPRTNPVIKKEPVYRTASPRYGLLLFGPERHHVWLVLDGDTLYVDRNGDGDLTNRGEKIAAQKKPQYEPQEHGYTFDVGDVTVGGRTHKGLVVQFIPLQQYADGSLGKRPDVKAVLAKDPKAFAVHLNVDAQVPGMRGGGIGGRIAFSAGAVDLTGILQFADRPADAPAVWCGGPLQVTFYSERPTLRVGRSGEFMLVVGTPGTGPGTFAMVGFKGTIPTAARPLAEVSFPSGRSKGPRVRQEFVLNDRC
jgi:hypothetical protein